MPRELLADIAARILMPPQDMPIGVLTGIIGGLFFIASCAGARQVPNSLQQLAQSAE